MCVLGTKGHLPLCTPLTKTNEHKPWSTAGTPKVVFYCRRNEGEKKRGEDKKEKIKRRVFSLCVWIFWGALRGCQHSYQHVCQYMSTLTVPKHVCPMKGEQLSCLYFPQKSAMMSPWTHLEPTSVKKHYSGPPSLSASFSVPPLPPSRSTPASRILHWAPILFLSSFLYFRILQHFLSPVHVSFLSLNCAHSPFFFPLASAA